MPGRPEGAQIVRLLLADLDPGEAYDRAWLLSDEELSRAKRFLDPAYGEVFMARRGLLRAELGVWMGVPPVTIEFGSRRLGKPFVVGHREVKFNVAHAGPLTLIAISDDEVGVDIETIDAIVDLEGIAQRVLSEREAAWLATLPSRRRAQGMLVTWARKEAAAKAHGDGLGLDLSTVETVQGVEAGAFEVRTAHTTWFLRDVTAPRRHAAALATRRHDVHLDFSIGLDGPVREDTRLAAAR